MTNLRQIVLDTETTGLSIGQGHRIIEIGCLELVNRRLTGREYHRFLNPERHIDDGAVRIHGISNADLEGQPRFSDVADELIDFLRDSELVIHNAEFDVANCTRVSATASMRCANGTRWTLRNAKCMVRSSTPSYSRVCTWR
jgi:DNA polymerase III epsilon subunit